MTASELLVVYGLPRPNDPLERGFRLPGTLSLLLRNQDAFEAALRSALELFLEDEIDVSAARLCLVRTVEDIANAARSSPATHLVYYGQAIPEASCLLPSPGNVVSATDLARIIRGTRIARADILGCDSRPFVEALARMLPQLATSRRESPGRNGERTCT